MVNKILLFFAFFLAFGLASTHAQGLTTCTGSQTWTTNCASTCINCNLDGLTGVTGINAPPGFHPDLCQGQLDVNNPHWYGFIAGSTTLTLAITPGACFTGTGLEAAILDNCAGIPACVPGPAPLNPAGAFIVQATTLVVGQPYQLMIDGFQGAQCAYTISVVNGSASPPPIGSIGTMTGNTQVCPNGTATYSIPPVANAVTYTWTAPTGASINGGSNVRTLPASGGNTVQITFGNSGGNVCVSASNACDPPVSTCMSVSNTPIPVTVLENAIICYQDTPYEWPEEPHTILAAPGTYTLTSSPYSSYLGCDSVVRQTLKLLPLNQTNLPVRYLCKDECFDINGITYCETGFYQETLVSENGCDSLVNFSLIKIQSNAVVQTPDTITCAVTSVPLSGAGSTTGNTVTYRWLNPDGQVISNAITATANAPGEYMFIVTNFVGGNQCRDTALVTVVGNLTPPLANAGPDMVITCSMPQTQLQGSGSMGSNFSYFWKALLGGNIVSGATTLNPTVDAPGTYSLRVTNNLNGCTAVNNAVVSADVTPPSINATGGSITCSNPSINIQLITNGQNPSFVWTGPNNFNSTQQNPSVNAPGAYSVTVTDGVTGCINFGSVQVLLATNPPGANATGGDITCLQTSVGISASSPTQGVSFQWSGPGGFTSNAQSPVVNAVGDYQVVVTGPNGCTSTATAIVALNDTPPGTTLSASSSLNCNNSTINLLASSSGNPADLNHEWTLPGGGNSSTGTQAFLAVTTPGVYGVVVNNTVTGCSSTASFTVIQRSAVTADVAATSNANCFNSTDGSITVSGSGGDGNYTYNWSDGGNAATNNNLGAGVYLVTITDGEGCSATASATLTEPAVLDCGATTTNQTINGAADGTAAANPTGGTPNYTFVWSTGETTQTLSGLLPGTYTVTVTDANGCTDVETVNVNAFDCTIQSSVVPVNISCFGETDGTAALDITGGTSPFNILWSNGETTNAIDSLPAGDYSVSVTDANNCPEVLTFSITEPQELQANATGSTTSGSNTTDGTATANPTGGTSPYTYNWSTGETTSSLSNLAPGAYRVTVTDANGCSAQQTVEVLPGNCGLTTNLQSTTPSCVGAADGSATVIVSGNSGNIQYAWSTGGTAATETNLPAGTHLVSITDENGCEILVTVELADPAALTITVDQVQNTTCPDAPAGTASVLVNGGTGPLSVSWSNGQTGLTAVDLIAGIYTAVVTDENGCSSSVEATVNANDTEAPVIVAGNTETGIGPNGDVVLTAQNTNTTITDNCGLASVVFVPASFSCTQLGDHQVEVTATDNAGLTTTETITVTIVDNTAPTLICSPSLVLCFEDNPVTYQAPTASDNCLILGGTFNIVEGLPIGAVFPLGSTTTTYNFTDAQGNVGSCSFEVTILPELQLEVDTVINDFNFQTVGAVFIDVQGSLPPYTYSWILNGQEVSTDQNISNIPAGDYTVIVTDDNGCTVSQTVTVDNTSDTKTPVLLSEIKVFPNPTSGQLNLLLPDDLVNQELFLQVFDLTGRRVLEFNSSQDKQVRLSLGDLADGLYSLVIRVGNDQTVRKIVLNQ